MYIFLTYSFYFRYTGWLCRGMISAASYTLVGVVNKFITILLNILLWDNHASYFGVICVCVCLLSGTFYEQAPKRDVLPLVSTNASVHLKSFAEGNKEKDSSQNLLSYKS
jgi:hypothetical protein